MKLLQDKFLQSSLWCLFFLLMFIFPAHAATNDTWQFQLAPYAGLAGQNGMVASLPPFPPADIDIKFYDDIAGNINGTFMLVGEACKGRYGIVADFAYTDIEIKDPTTGPFFTLLPSRTDSWIVSAAGFYRLTEQQGTFLDLIGGVRYWSVDSTLTLQEGLLPKQSISNKENWFDPIIGLKGFSPLGDSNFFLSGFHVLGGFGVGSDFM